MILIKFHQFRAGAQKRQQKTTVLGAPGAAKMVKTMKRPWNFIGFYDFYDFH